MPEQVSGGKQEALQAEIARLNKMIQALMNRAERNASLQGSDFNLFQTAITLEDQVRRRTQELEASRLENEKITRALRESENRNRLLVENSPMGIYEIALDGRITSMNRAGLQMLGIQKESEIQASKYLDTVSEADRQRIAKLLSVAYSGTSSCIEYECSNADNQIYKSCFVPIRNSHDEVVKVMGIMEDITERKRAEEQIHNLAFYDALTQLANRRLLNDRLTQAMALTKRSGRYGALMFMDLDNFKPLNDTYGHNMGDQLLIEAAQRITRCVREMDTVARLGGDEFVVMLSELDEDGERSAAQAGIVAEKIRIALAEPYLLSYSGEGGIEKRVEHHCTASIGVALFIRQEASPEEMLKRADMAMYKAKDEGRNRVCVVH